MQDLRNDVHRHWKNPKRSPSPLLATLRGPDLVWAPQANELSNRRVAIVGQQQKDCDYSSCEFVGRWSVERAVKTYETFNFAENYQYRNSFFWQFFDTISAHFHGFNHPLPWVALLFIISIQAI